MFLGERGLCVSTQLGLCTGGWVMSIGRAHSNVWRTSGTIPIWGRGLRLVTAVERTGPTVSKSLKAEAVDTYLNSIKRADAKALEQILMDDFTLQLPQPTARERVLSRSEAIAFLTTVPGQKLITETFSFRVVESLETADRYCRGNHPRRKDELWSAVFQSLHHVVQIQGSEDL